MEVGPTERDASRPLVSQDTSYPDLERNTKRFLWYPRTKRPIAEIYNDYMAMAASMDVEHEPTDRMTYDVTIASQVVRLSYYFVYLSYH